MRQFFLALAAILAISVAPAAAAEFAPYEKAKLEAIIKSGAPVVVHVHAEWCPICRRQIVVLDEIFKSSALAKVQKIRVNYDKDRDFISAFKVKRQANILVFKDGKEVARVDYDPDADRIRAAVNRAI
jgi:thiol-disulfide isomerase/thioredoxin